MLVRQRFAEPEHTGLQTGCMHDGVVDNVHSMHPLTLPCMVKHSYIDCGSSSHNHFHIEDIACYAVHGAYNSHRTFDD